MINLYGDGVGAAIIQVWRYFILKGNKAVRPFPEVFSVDPYLAIFIHAIEVDKYLFSSPAFIGYKGFLIPAYAARQKACSAGPLVAKGTFNAPVVRQLYRLPLNTSSSACASIGYVAFVKRPVIVK